MSNELKEQFEKIIKESQQPSYEEHVEWCMQQAYELGQPKWISIEDANIKPDTNYWCYTIYKGIVVMYWDGALFHFGGAGYNIDNVTHVADYFKPTPPQP